MSGVYKKIIVLVSVPVESDSYRVPESPSPAGLDENATVNYPPAENQLGEVSCCHVCMAPEHGDGMDLRLLFNAVFKFFYYVCAQFPIHNQLPHMVPSMVAVDKFKTEIPFR